MPRTQCKNYRPRSWSERQSTLSGLLTSRRPCVQTERGCKKCYPSVMKHAQKVNVTLWEVNFQCTKFHLVPCRRIPAKSILQYAAHLLQVSTPSPKPWNGEPGPHPPGPSRFITPRAMAIIRALKSPQKRLFYNLPWKQISVINTLFIKFLHMLKPVKVESSGIFLLQRR